MSSRRSAGARLSVGPGMSSWPWSYSLTHIAEHRAPYYVTISALNAA